MDHIGVVVIGRNEGERLRRCLASVNGAASAIVYVDSASSDDSIALARGVGVEVLDLDMSIPFSAARARNAGYNRLIAADPSVGFIQFVDGDCEVVAGWLAAAVEALRHRGDLAIVAGRLNERFPHASVYNRLGDLEWNFAQPGEVDSVGGIFMIRREAFDSVGGFDPTVTAGEEPELCKRLALRGWKMLRLDRDMAWHDLAMTRFGQWWKRQQRTGYGGMDVAQRFGLPFFRRNNLRARFWTLAWPVAVVIAAVLGASVAGAPAGALAAGAVLALGPMQAARIAIRTRRRGYPWNTAAPYGVLTVVSFWPQMLGQVRYLFDRSRGKAPRLIEYKTPIRPINNRGQTQPPVETSTR